MSSGATDGDATVRRRGGRRDRACEDEVARAALLLLLLLLGVAGAVVERPQGSLPAPSPVLHSAPAPPHRLGRHHLHEGVDGLVHDGLSYHHGLRLVALLAEKEAVRPFHC